MVVGRLTSTLPTIRSSGCSIYNSNLSIAEEPVHFRRRERGQALAPAPPFQPLSGIPGRTIMFTSARLPLRGLLLAALLVAGCSRSHHATEGPSVLEVDGVAMPVTGPFAHQNLAVFLIHSEQQDPREFITLDEGLKNGSVKVSERAQEQVNKLQIDNQSDYPLFLQEGDRLQGGKQDRTIYTSMVVPPHSGNMDLPAFCIEQSRWTAGSNGAFFAGVSNTALAPKAVRIEGKVNMNQGGVWSAVRSQKYLYASLADYNTSSLNEALDAPKVKELSDQFATALSSPVEGHPTAVGVAIAVNGKIEEVNIYPNHALLRKLYPRLLQSYALQANAEKDKAKEGEAATVADVVAFMAQEKEKDTKVNTIDSLNTLEIRELDKRVECRSTYDGTLVHRQRLSNASVAQRGTDSIWLDLNNEEIGLDPTEPARIERAPAQPQQKKLRVK
jgi:hypothetical protein